MPRKIRRKIQVIISEHAKARWTERVGHPSGRLHRLLKAKLLEQSRTGLTVSHGRVLVQLGAEDLGIPQDLVACIELPNWKGVWRVVTFYVKKIKPLCESGQS
jgi:hypothetical protein